MKLKHIISNFLVKAELDIKRFLISILPNSSFKKELLENLHIEKMRRLNPINKLRCSVGEFSYASSSLNVQHSKTTIGKFCSIAQDVMIGPGEHPLNYLSSSPCFYTICLAGKIEPVILKLNPILAILVMMSG